MSLPVISFSIELRNLACRGHNSKIEDGPFFGTKEPSFNQALLECLLTLVKQHSSPSQPHLKKLRRAHKDLKFNKFSLKEARCRTKRTQKQSSNRENCVGGQRGRLYSQSVRAASECECVEQQLFKHNPHSRTINYE